MSELNRKQNYNINQKITSSKSKENNEENLMESPI